MENYVLIQKKKLLTKPYLKKCICSMDPEKWGYKNNQDGEKKILWILMEETNNSHIRLDIMEIII